MRTLTNTGSIWRRSIEKNPPRYQCRPGRPARPSTVCRGDCGGLGGRRDGHPGRDAGRSRGAILRVFGIATVDGAVVQEALQLHFTDFEDAVTAAAARFAGCEFIVTRDPKGFRGSPARSLTPEAVTPLLDKK
jgi:hypothetical protein